MAKPIILCDTKGMDRERWLECRMHGPKGDIEYTLGGSDISTIFGLNPWMTPLELWKIKKGLMKPIDPPNPDQLEMGHLLEPIAAHFYGKRTGNIVIEDTHLYQHASIPYALANFDYRFKEPAHRSDPKSGIVECKSTTYRKADNWADDAVPIYYELQGRWYMSIADEGICDYAALWGNNPENDLATPRIYRDLAKEEAIIERAEEFIHSLRTNNPPSMSDVANPELALKALARVYGHSKRGLPTLEFTRKYERPLRRIAALQIANAELREAIKNNEKEMEAHSVRIAEVMKEHEHDILETGHYKLLVSFVTKFTRRPDSKLLQKEYPDVYNEVLKSSPSRKVKVEVQAI